MFSKGLDLLEIDFYFFSRIFVEVQGRPWHDARAIARARAITRANQEKGGLRGR